MNQQRDRMMATAVRDEEMAYVQAGLGTDLDTLAVFNLLRTHSYLAPFLNAGLRRQDLTAAQFNALLLLREAGSAGLSMREIGRKLVVTRSNVTGLVDRLERQGLVARREQRDRRSTAVVLTVVGRSSLGRAAPRHAALLGQVAACLSEREKRTLINLLTRLRRELRKHHKGGG